MTPERWLNIKEILADAVALEGAARSSFLANACQGNPQLLAHVQSFLRSEEETTMFQNGAAGDLAPGYVIADQYVVARKLGSGGFATTYMAQNRLAANRPVAVKVLAQQHVHDEWVKSKFDQELTALSRIRNPGVVMPLSSGQLADGRPYLVMEYVDGEPLLNLMTESLIPLDRVAAIIKQIGQILDAVHAHSILHRDLKPANIMLERQIDGSDRVRIIDFGIASILESGAVDGQSTRVVGTLRYMAPEQLLGHPVRGSDVYAFGVIVGEMLAGQSDGASARLIPSNAQILLDQTRLADPQARPASAASFADAVALAITTPERRWGRAYVTGALAALAILGVVLFLLAFKKQSPAQPQPAVVVAAERQLRLQLVGGNANSFESALPLRPTAPVTLGPEDRFRILFISSEQGQLYLFAGSKDKDELNILFPSPTANAGSAVLKPGERLQVPERNWFHFGERPEATRLWVVWAADPLPDLERARTWANEEHGGAVKDGAERTLLRSVLRTNEAPLVMTGDSALLRGRKAVLSAFLDISLRNP